MTYGTSEEVPPAALLPRRVRLALESGRQIAQVAELRERFEAFKRRSLYDVNLVVLFLEQLEPDLVVRDPKRSVDCR